MSVYMHFCFLFLFKRGMQKIRVSCVRSKGHQMPCRWLPESSPTQEQLATFVDNSGNMAIRLSTQGESIRTKAVFDLRPTNPYVDRNGTGHSEVEAELQ